MQAFCKLLYNQLRLAIKDQEKHKSLRLHSSTANARQSDLTALPETIRSNLLTTTSSYLPVDVIEPQKVNDRMTHVVRVIPNTGTRVDTYFLSGPHTVDVNTTYICDIIELYVRVLEAMAPKKINNVQIVILPTKHKKQMDMNTSVVLGPRHINSGMMHRQLNYAFIVVYRFEELFKVLLHELMHLYQFDYYEYPEVAALYANDLKRRYNIESARLCMSETFNDAVALTFYLGFFIAIRRPQYMESLEQFTNSYRANYVHMTNYLVKMAAKLMIYCDRHFNGTLREDTHMFAYYIAKAALFVNSRKMFQFLKFNKLHIGQDNDQIIKFVNTVIKSLESKAYKSKLLFYKQQLLQGTSTSEFFSRTLRMCNFDLYPTEKKN